MNIILASQVILKDLKGFGSILKLKNSVIIS